MRRGKRTRNKKDGGWKEIDNKNVKESDGIDNKKEIDSVNGKVGINVEDKKYYNMDGITEA